MSAIILAPPEESQGAPPLKFQVLWDASEVLKAFNGEDNWSIKCLINDMLNFSSIFISAGFDCVPIDLDWVAHRLAKFRIVYNGTFDWFENYPLSSLL